MVTHGLMYNIGQSAPRGSPLIAPGISAVAGEPRGGLEAVRFETRNEKYYTKYKVIKLTIRFVLLRSVKDCECCHRRKDLVIDECDANMWDILCD